MTNQAPLGAAAHGHLVGARRTLGATGISLLRGQATASSDVLERGSCTGLRRLAPRAESYFMTRHNRQ